MKKLIITTLILGVAVTASACGTKPASSVENPPQPKPVQTEAPAPIKTAEKNVDGPLKLAYEGKVTNVQIGLGASLQEVISVMGEPIELGHFEGSSFVNYENITFMLSEVVEDTTGKAEIIGIIASEGYELYGIKVGMSMAEIKQVLGAAQQEYKDNEDEGGMWILEYQCGDYKLTFYFIDQVSPSTSAYLSKL